MSEIIDTFMMELRDPHPLCNPAMESPLTAARRKSEPLIEEAFSGIGVGLFDDHAPVRDALASMLARQSGIYVVATGQSADEAVSCAEAILPDVMILDINMDGDGIKAAQKIFLSCPAIKVVMLTSFDDAHLVEAALSSGACGFLVKGEPVSEIAKTIRAVYAGGSYLPPSLAAKLIGNRAVATPWSDADDDGSELLEREEQILRGLAQGLTYEEIGSSIGLNADSVSAFVTNILLKLHADTAAAAII